MTPLGWGWAAFVWGYAIVWFLITDRVKLLGYRILDPTKDNPVHTGGDADPRPLTPGNGSDADAARDRDSTATGEPFHTDTDTDPDLDDDVYHDNDDCPYAKEVKRNGNDKPGTENRRQCEWCNHHPVRV